MAVISVIKGMFRFPQNEDDECVVAIVTGVVTGMRKKR